MRECVGKGKCVSVRGWEGKVCGEKCWAEESVVYGRKESVCRREKTV